MFILPTFTDMKKYIIAVWMAVSLLTARGQGADSIDFKIGQMLMIGVTGTDIDESVKADIAGGKVGGVLLFEKNIAPANSYIRLKRFINALQKEAPLPLFVAIDQEGGAVNRLKTKYGFPQSVSAEYLGTMYSADSTRFYAEITAATLAGLGFNVNFAPVVDFKVAGNPVISGNRRAYSEDPDMIIMHATEAVRAMRRYGIVSVLKHFPGHGSSRSDSHLGMADVTDYWSEEELKPYEKMIESGHADAVMSAHIVNKKLDADGLPGTLSAGMIDSLLRKTLHFDGVVFSDDMQMHAITQYFGLKKAVKLAIMAGIDVLIFSNNIQDSRNRTTDHVHRLIRELVEEGEIPPARIDEAYRRIVTLKSANSPCKKGVYEGD